MKFDVLKSQMTNSKLYSSTRSTHFKSPTIASKPPILQHDHLPLRSKLNKVTSDINLHKYLYEEQQNLGSSNIIASIINHKPSNKSILSTDQIIEKIRTNIGLLQSKINLLFDQQIEEDQNTGKSTTDQRTTELTDNNNIMQRENHFTDPLKKDKSKNQEKTSRASQNKYQNKGMPSPLLSQNDQN